MAEAKITPKTIERLRDLQVDGRQDMSYISPLDIVIEDGFNPRDFSLPHNRKHLDNLKAQIVAPTVTGAPTGILKPLMVRWDNKEKKAILIDGECRLRSVLELINEGHEILSVPVIQKSGKVVDKLEDRIVMALAANESLNLSQIELGKTYLRLKALGWPAEQIAQRVGKTDRFVRDALVLADSPDAVQAMVQTGQVSKAAAISAVKDSNGDGDHAAAKLQEAIKKAADEGRIKVTAPKSDKKQSKLSVIKDIIEEYEAFEPSDLTKDKLIGFLAEIADILDENPAAMKAVEAKDAERTGKSKKAPTQAAAKKKKAA